MFSLRGGQAGGLHMQSESLHGVSNVQECLRVVASKRAAALQHADHGNALKHVNLGDISPSLCAASEASLAPSL